MKRALALTLLAACSSQPAEDCNNVGTVAAEQVDARIAKHSSGCTQDDDCTLIDGSLTCFRGCMRAVRTAQVSATQTELAQLSQLICGDTQCEVNVGCVPVVARCSHGSCKALEGAAPDAGQGDGGMRDAG